MKDFLIIGKIINVHGIKGEVKVLPLTDDPDRFYDLNEVYIEKDKTTITLSICNVRKHKNSILITFEEIINRNQAEELKEMYIYIDRKDAIKLSEDQYFLSDLIDCMVYSVAGHEIGKVKDVLQNGPTDTYVIKTSNKEILVPALKEIFKEIDIKNKIIKADIPKGLMEL